VRPLLLAALLWAAPHAPTMFTLDELVPISAAMQRGTRLYELDAAGALAGNDLRSKLGSAAPLPAGWIAELEGKKGDVFVVTYYADSAAGPAAVYEARVRKGRLVSSKLFPAEARPSLTPAQRRLAGAVAAATARPDLKPCTSAPFKALAIPPEKSDAPVEVYLLSVPAQAGAYPVGGHYLVRVGSDGRVISTRAFAPACLDAVPEIRPGSRRVLAIADPADAVPTEIHFYLSRAFDLPVEVSTDGPPRRWTIEGGNMTMDSR